MFKKIENYDYEVSDTGEVRNIKTGKMLKPEISKDGHLRIDLYKNGKVKHCYVHRLVLEAFVGPCPKGMEGCHNNGKVSNNSVENLRWDTHKNNVKDSIDQGTFFIQKGSKHWAAKLTENQVKEIRIRYIPYSHDNNTCTLAKEFGVSNVEIGRIITNKRWKHIK